MFAVQVVIDDEMGISIRYMLNYNGKDGKEDQVILKMNKTI